MNVYPQITLSTSPLQSMISLDTIQSLQPKAIALVNNNLIGAYPFWHTVHAQGGHPVLGLSVHVQSGAFVFLYARNQNGWRNLIRLSSALETKELTVAPTKWITTYSEDCYVVVPNTQWEKESARELLNAIPKDRIIGAVARQNGISHPNEEHFLHFMKGAPIIVTHETRYPLMEDAFAYDVLVAIGEGTKMPDVTRLEPIYFIPTAEDWNLWYADHPEWLEKTERILFSCRVNLTKEKNYMPAFPSDNPKELLFALANEGMNKYFTHADERYHQRLQSELDTIVEMGYVDYFLIVADYMKFAKENNILTGPGRGSSASSLVACCLGITKVDPIRYKLLFERFLNKERITLPDIDIDFDSERRKEVITYIRDKYGAMHVAQIGAPGTLASKAASRDVGKVLGFSKEELTEMSSYIPESSRMDLRKVWETRDEKFERFVLQSEGHKRWIRVASQLEGVAKTISTHAAGLVLSPIPLTQIVPLAKGTDDFFATQWPMEDVEKAGLLKMDLLGLRNLTFLREILSHLPKEFSLDEIPLDDPKTIELFRQAQMTGIFQFESSGMQKSLHVVQPDSFEDLVAISALYRPGPMQYIGEYASRKHGKSIATYPHPSTEKILKETHGIMVYQEQIMQVASEVAGYTYGQADLLRRAITKKNLSILTSERRGFLEGAHDKGIPNDVASQVFDDIVKFADYGFPKSHAVAYTIISFQLAYLKANYPEAFYSALLNQSKGNGSKLDKLIREIKMREIPISPPSIFNSKLETVAEDGQIILGLHFIKGMSAQSKQRIIDTQEKGWKSFFELAFDLGTLFTEGNVLPLIYAGALDGFGHTRQSLIESIPVAMKFLTFYRTEESSAITYEEIILLGVPRYVQQAEFSEQTRLIKELETFGFYWNGHPVESIKQELNFTGETIAFCKQSLPEQTVHILGEVESIRRIKTKKKDSMAFLTIQDETDTIPCVLFPKQFETYRELIKEKETLHIKGKIERRDNEMQLIINHIQTI